MCVSASIWMKLVVGVRITLDTQWCSVNMCPMNECLRPLVWHSGMSFKGFSHLMKLFVMFDNR